MLPVSQETTIIWGRLFPPLPKFPLIMATSASSPPVACTLTDGLVAFLRELGLSL